MSEIRQRIMNALYKIRADGLPIDVFTVWMHPENRLEMLRELPQWETFVDGQLKVYGLPVETDSRMSPGDIVFRYEVAA